MKTISPFIHPTRYKFFDNKISGIQICVSYSQSAFQVFTSAETMLTHSELVRPHMQNIGSLLKHDMEWKWFKNSYAIVLFYLLSCIAVEVKDAVIWHTGNSSTQFTCEVRHQSTKVMDVQFITTKAVHIFNFIISLNIFKYSYFLCEF